MNLTVYFVRHGQTDWNAEHRLQGQADIEMNAVGRGEATRNGRVLSKLIDHPDAWDFVASPMRRTRETMELIRAELGLDPSGYRTDPRLVEINFGDWQGFTLAELEVDDPGASQRRAKNKWAFVPPGEGAESYAMLAERIRPWFEAIARDTVCVTHGGVIRTIFRMVSALGASGSAGMLVHQDKVLRLAEGHLEWL